MPTDQQERVLTPEAARHEYLAAERAKWLTIKEAAFVLSVCQNTIFRMIDANALPVRREGRAIRIHLDDLRPYRQEGQP